MAKDYIKISKDPKTQAQVHMLLAIQKMKEWFDNLPYEEKLKFAEEHPDLIETS